MNNMIWLLRAARWVRSPPSAGRVRLTVAIVVAVIALGTLDRLGWWPDWATVNPRGGRTIRPQHPGR